MSRKFIVGLALAGGLGFGAVDSVGAQPAPLCSTFGPGSAGLENWGPCPGAPNIVVTTSNVGSIAGPTDYHLHLRDLAGASAACSTNQKYMGDWVAKMGGCGQFCFDFKVFVSGSPPGPITPSFTIWHGAQSATFVANFTVTANDPWRQHICAPINLIQPGDSLPSGGSGSWRIGGSNAYNPSWNAIISGVTMMQLPIDWTSDPDEEAGYDNLCMTPGGCGNTTTTEVTGCLKDSKVAVTCNPDGTYTVTLSGVSFTGTDITLASDTPGVTVTPPQQPWAATTTWTVTGATPGETVTLTANATQVGGGADGTDQCCSGEIKIVMPDCPKPQVGEVIVEKKVKNETQASASQINSLVFPIGLTCGLPSTLGVTFGLSNGGTHTENNVPYGSLCTVTESTGALPSVPGEACGPGMVAVWALPVITPLSATINAPVTVFTVVNELDCKKVGEVGSLIVGKKVVDHAPVAIPSQNYPVTVTCGGTITTFTLVDGGSHTVSNIPLGTSCTVTEGTLTLPANVCPRGTTPAWSTAYVPPSPLVVNGTNVTETVVNTLDCGKVGEVGSLTVTKKVVSHAPVAIPSQNYPVTVTCGGTITTFTLVDGGSHTVSNIPLGTSCAVAEGAPAQPANVCPRGSMPAWSTTFVPPGPVIVNGSNITETVVNTLDCRTGIVIAPPTCDPSTTVKRGGDCACRYPGMMKSSAGACMCVMGDFVAGRGCVQKIECRAPMVSNAAGTACGCPAGTVQRGRECVKPTVCNAPAKLNRRGVCECPGNTVAVGNTCVEQKRQPQINIPGRIPGIGPRGGQDNPGGPRGGNQGPAGGLPGR